VLIFIVFIFFSSVIYTYYNIFCPFFPALFDYFYFFGLIAAQDWKNRGKSPEKRSLKRTYLCKTIGMVEEDSLFGGLLDWKEWKIAMLLIYCFPFWAFRIQPSTIQNLTLRFICSRLFKKTVIGRIFTYLCIER
jgi:hypothetical protein